VKAAADETGGDTWLRGANSADLRFDLLESAN
jgi:hypothetical protein